MLEIINRAFWSRYKTLNKINVSRGNLIQNYKLLSALNSNIKVAPVLKSNAYGHGITIVGRILDHLAPPFLCVDSIYEGYELLKAGIKSPILIMGYVSPANLKIKKLPFSYAVYEKETLDEIHKYQPQAGIHIFVDSGMHREGVKVDDLPELLKLAKSLRGIRIEGLMSHFARAERPEDPLTQEQVKQFDTAQEICREFNIFPRWVHLAASSGLINHNKFKGKLGNLARVGVSSYGIDPTGEFSLLKPTLSMYSTICQIKKVTKDERIGYDFSFRAESNMRLGILPIGYNDGLDRRLSNSGCVYINNQRCPVVGRISMNITTVDVSDVENLKVGNEVEVFSSNPTRANSVKISAEACGTIPYEFLVHLNPAIRREVV